MNKQYDSERDRTPEEVAAANAIDAIIQGDALDALDETSKNDIIEVCIYAGHKLRQPKFGCLEWNRLDIEAAALHEGKKLSDIDSLMAFDWFFRTYDFTIKTFINDLMAEFVREQFKNS